MLAPQFQEQVDRKLSSDARARELAELLSTNSSSVMLPSFYQRLIDPSVKSVLIAGCGGGFDFLHSMLLLPEFKRLGKKVGILSFSFGVVRNLQKAEVVFEGAVSGDHLAPKAKLVTKNTVGSTKYQPEIGLRSFLDLVYPSEAPHEIYACYARGEICILYLLFIILIFLFYFILFLIFLIFRKFCFQRFRLKIFCNNFSFLFFYF
jgi:hypothetical protein